IRIIVAINEVALQVPENAFRTSRMILVVAGVNVSDASAQVRELNRLTSGSKLRKLISEMPSKSWPRRSLAAGLLRSLLALRTWRESMIAGILLVSVWILLKNVRFSEEYRRFIKAELIGNLRVRPVPWRRSSIR